MDLALRRTRLYHALVHSHASLRNRWRRLVRKYGFAVFLAFVVGGVLALVYWLMYMLTTPGSWRLGA